MAGFEVDFPEDLLSEFFASDIEGIAKEALEEAAPILEKSMKSAARSAIMHSGESEAVESIKAAKPRKGKDDGYSVYVRPTGSSTTKTYHHTQTGRTYAVSNALKLIWKEYGIAHPHHHQPARPFLAKAKNDAEAKCVEKMQEVFEKKVGANGS